MLQLGNKDASESSPVWTTFAMALVEDDLSPRSLEKVKSVIPCMQCPKRTSFCDLCPKRRSLGPTDSFIAQADEREWMRNTNPSATEWMRNLEELWIKDLALHEGSWITEWGTDAREIGGNTHSDRVRISTSETSPEKENSSQKKENSSPEKEPPSQKKEFLQNALKYAKKGDKSAFEVLYWNYTKPIWNRLIGLVGKKEVAEELHQETFLRAWTHLPSLDNTAPFERWLYKVAAHIAIDYLRHTKKLSFVSLPEEASAQHSSTAYTDTFVKQKDHLCKKQRKKQRDHTDFSIRHLLKDRVPIYKASTYRCDPLVLMKTTLV